MRKILGILFIILGIVWLPSCYSPESAVMLGRLIGNTLLTFLPAYLLLRKSGKKKDEDSQQYQY